jgi:hypothetical protein
MSVFQYSPLFAAVAYAGLIVGTILAVVLIGVSIDVALFLNRPISMKLDGMFVGLLGCYFGWLTILSWRYWYFLVTRYSVDDRGIAARLFSSHSVYTWDTLESARYRRAMGFLEVKFRNSARPAVLTPMGTLAELQARSAIFNVISIIERQTSVTVRRSLF